MPPKINYDGRRFGRLVVLERVAGTGRLRCLCDCGNTRNVVATNLTNGRQVSCGCFRKAHARIHGGSGTVEYKAWQRMKDRCTNPKRAAFIHYGGRGINICEHWQTDFAKFLADLGPKPSPRHSVDKDTPGGDGNYHCDACGGRVRWATQKEQIANRRH